MFSMGSTFLCKTVQKYLITLLGYQRHFFSKYNQKSCNVWHFRDHNRVEEKSMLLEEALFVSLLPYRRRLYRDGGWRYGPHSNDWKYFLALYYTAAEINKARQQTAPALNSAAGVPYRTLSIWDEHYPADLRQVYDPPPILFLRGDPLPSAGEWLAIVGTRNPAPIVRAAVHAYVGQLPGCPTIVSGFARGVDREAHLAAIQRGLHTVAVLGSGLNQIGPRSNLDLLTMAHRSGAAFSILTEFPPHIVARPHTFPRRNRIIAGLISRVAVMQAPQKSGALITARYALEEGRDVCVYDHPLLAGTGFNEGARKLLQDGAQLVELPQLDQRVIEQPPFSKIPQKEQLHFWKLRDARQLRWLGDRYYLKL